MKVIKLKAKLTGSTDKVQDYNFYISEGTNLFFRNFYSENTESTIKSVMTYNGANFYTLHTCEEIRDLILNEY